MNIILASGSPRRKELLRLIIPKYSCVTSDINEVCPEGTKPDKRPEYLAKIKANDVYAKHHDSIVIGADTAVFSDNKMLGKPKDENDAFLMLKSLSGKTHQVITGCAVISKEKEYSFSVKTDVTFFELTDKEISDYIKTKEPFDKAGGYGIQGFGSLLIKEINGDYFNVVGLPVSTLNKVLKDNFKI